MRATLKSIIKNVLGLINSSVKVRCWENSTQKSSKNENVFYTSFPFYSFNKLKANTGPLYMIIKKMFCNIRCM